ncbi:unnamed protein product [Owenia fusiformis]|uniref:KASH domain-containing protein n=1 Tax=Owenia fusiformis TaxID=6347 RepID=A0A8S4PCK1_OWEFU|nr:unnamed protein product [Owenia fusiformis]
MTDDIYTHSSVLDRIRNLKDEPLSYETSSHYSNHQDLHGNLGTDRYSNHHRSSLLKEHLESPYQSNLSEVDYTPSSLKSDFSVYTSKYKSTNSSRFCSSCRTSSETPTDGGYTSRISTLTYGVDTESNVGYKNSIDTLSSPTTSQHCFKDLAKVGEAFSATKDCIQAAENQWEKFFQDSETDQAWKISSNVSSSAGYENQIKTNKLKTTQSTSNSESLNSKKSQSSPRYTPINGISSPSQHSYKDVACVLKSSLGVNKFSPSLSQNNDTGYFSSDSPQSVNHNNVKTMASYNPRDNAPKHLDVDKKQFFPGDYAKPWDSPTEAKRLKIEDPVTPSSVGSFSPTESPSFRQLLRYDDSFYNSSENPSPVDSPDVKQKGDKEQQKKYKKNELWASIKSDYQYCMDEEIIEQCKSTESDLSWGEEDDLLRDTNVSFTEFMQQYKELTDWLNQVQLVTQRQSSSLSEKYLNQTYYEEMLQNSPRRKLFNDYAKQLMRRYPAMKDEIQLPIQQVNNQWKTIEKAITPGGGKVDTDAMLGDLEQDLNGLRKWLHDVESHLLPMCLSPQWSPEILTEKLKEHQVLQRDIESHSKIVSAVLKLCERLQLNETACENTSERESLQLVAVNLERRWHAIWLQSLEWQCRLEEAITQRKMKIAGLYGTSLYEVYKRYKYVSHGYLFNRRVIYKIQLKKYVRPFNFARILDINKKTVLTGSNFRTSEGSGSNWSDFSYNTAHSDLPRPEPRDVTRQAQYDDYNESPYSSDEYGDVIPFDEHEYEKIEDDSENEPNELVEEYSKELQDKLQALEDNIKDEQDYMDIDNVDVTAALSDSDYSFETANCKEHNNSNLQEDEYTKLKPRNSSGKLGSLSAMESRLVAKNAQKYGVKVESHDIGYSSESHSNDEQHEAMKSGASIDTSHVDKSSVKLRQKTSHSRDVSMDEMNDTSLTNVSSLPESSWRHSMTSAYDTSSDHNSPTDDDEHKTVEEDSAVEKSGPKSIPKSGDKDYYKMTSVDVDATCGLLSQSPPTHDVGLTPYKAQPFQIPNLGESPGVDVATYQESGKVEQIARRLDFGAMDTSDVTDGKETIGEEEGMGKEGSGTSDSLSVQVDSDALQREDGFISDDFLMEEQVDAPPRSPNKEAIKRLIKQAELLVMDDEQVHKSITFLHSRESTNPDLRPPKCKSPDLSSSKSSPRDLPTDSLASTLSTEGSMLGEASACEASGEYTSNSEAEYYSTASSDEEQYNSVLRMSTSHSSDLLSSGHNSQSNLGSPVKQRNRPSSVTEMYELTNRLDLSPFSISESAIDNIPRERGSKSSSAASSRDRLSRTNSERSTHSLRVGTPTRKLRNKSRKLKRSISEAEQNSDITKSHDSLGSAEIFENAETAPCSPPEATLSLPGNCQELNTGAFSSKYSSNSRETLTNSQNIAQCYTSSDAYNGARPKTSIPSHISQRRKKKSRSKRRNGSGSSGSESGSDVEHVPDVKVASSADNTDDLINSTVESFSEEAWDNYQIGYTALKYSAPMYTSVSEDPNEEKLTDTALQWEPSEYEEDFDFKYAASLGGNKSPPEMKKNKERKYKGPKPSPGGFTGDVNKMEDSDSDIEDLHHVIKESTDQIHVAAAVLKKYRKDVMDTGIYLDPSKYAEVVATCQMNITCLEVISDTLESDQGMANLTEEDLQQMEDTLAEWDSLHSLGLERQAQSRDLLAIYKQFVTLSQTLAEYQDELGNDVFEDVSKLESAVKHLQNNRLDVQPLRDDLERVKNEIASYARQNQHISMTKFQEETMTLSDQVEEVADRSSKKIDEFKSTLITWYDHDETMEELKYLLHREEGQLQCLELTHDVIDFTEQDIKDTLYDLKGMKSDLDKYDDKLENLRNISADICKIADTERKNEIRANIGTTANELASLKLRCERLEAAFEERLNTGDFKSDGASQLELIQPETSKVAMETTTVAKATEDDSSQDSGMDSQEGATTETDGLAVDATLMSIDETDATVVAEATDASGASGVTGATKENTTQTELKQCLETEDQASAHVEGRSWVKRILRAARPVQVMIVAVFLAACILDPRVNDATKDLGIILNPELRYVKGPPPF